MEQSSLISHQVSAEAIDACIQKISLRIRKQGDKPYASVAYQLELLQQLSQFDFGRFLLRNQGINGYWTDYMFMHPLRGRITGHNAQGERLTPLEHFILDSAPLMLATQQRCQIFLLENQKKVEEHAVLACVPCGMMGELLYLNYERINNIQLHGIDYDADTLDDATLLAKNRKHTSWVTLHQADAWALDAEGAYDLISSNGLTIYEPDDLKVTQLFELFYQALKTGGKLVTSFLTPPPTQTEPCEWDLSKIDKDHLLLQKILFVDIIDARFQCYRTSLQTKKQLEDVGFNRIEFIYDRAKIFPTVVAYKN